MPSEAYGAAEIQGGDLLGGGGVVKTDGPSPEITDLRCPLFSDVLGH
jgi:hypothetical protein